MGRKKENKRNGLKRKENGKGVSSENALENQYSPDTHYADIPEDYSAVIGIVKDFWLTLSKEQQLEFLTVSVQDLQSQARKIQETTIKELGVACTDKLQKEQVVDVEFQHDTCERALEQGLQRMKQGRTCKEWIWNRNDVQHTSAQDFRQYIVENHIPPELRDCLPADQATESPAEKSLRKRMSEVGRKVQVLGGWTQEYQLSNGQAQNGGQKKPRRWAIKEPKALYEKHIEVLLYMLNALEKEHGFLQEFVFVPVQSFMKEALGSGQFDVIEFSSEDLHRLHQEDVYSIIEWVIEKIEMLSSKWKLDPEEDLDEGDEEDNVAEIDLFKLTEDGSSLVVEPKWFDHLADRVLGPDGTPKKRTPDCQEKQGLVLDWIYGMIVSTAERAREACRHALGQRLPTFEHALNLFVRALQIQHIYSEVQKVLGSLTDSMSESSSSSSDSSTVFNLNCLAYKARALCSLMEAWTFNKQFKQYRPTKEFDHMHLLSQIMKSIHQPANKVECLDVLLQTQQDVSNYKQSQLDLITKVYGTKFFHNLTKIIGAYDGKKVVEHLRGMLCFQWASQNLEAALQRPELPILTESEIQKELHCVTQRLKQLSQKIVEGTAALHHLEMNLVNLACEDPGALISMHLALPLIQKRLYHSAHLHAEQRANAVCEDLISSIDKENMRKEARRQKKKKKQKLRSQQKEAIDQLAVCEEEAGEEVDVVVCEKQQLAVCLVEAQEEVSVCQAQLEICQQQEDEQEVLFEGNCMEATDLSQEVSTGCVPLQTVVCAPVQTEVSQIQIETSLIVEIGDVENTVNDSETSIDKEEQEECQSNSGPLSSMQSNRVPLESDFSIPVSNNLLATSSRCSVTQEEKMKEMQQDVQEDECCSTGWSASHLEEETNMEVERQEEKEVVSPLFQSVITTPTPTVVDAVSDFNVSEDSPIYGLEMKQLKNKTVEQQAFHPLIADLLIQEQAVTSMHLSPESSYSRMQLQELPSFDIWDTPIDCLNDTITSNVSLTNDRRLDGVLPTDMLVCPITKSFFCDPVVAADGNTYERKAIELWMSYFTHSPISGEKLLHKLLVPNHLVRCMIDGIRQTSCSPVL